MRATTMGLQPLSALDGPREIIRQFTPNWFAATMGTGILAIVLAQLPGPARAVAEGLWLFNIALFTLFTGLYAARWVFFFAGARRILGHSVMSMFFGCIPMGLATIVNGFLIFGPSRFGPAAIEIATLLWWVDVAMSVTCGLIIPYMMFTRQTHSIEQMTAVWLLPLVAAEVAAVSGGMLAPHLADPHAQLSVLWLSYVLWALSVPVAMSVLVILLLRLAVHKLPDRSMAPSCWLALGPIGTGALGLITLGQAAPAILQANGLAGYGVVASGIGIIGGTLVWGYGLWWFGMATLITLRYARQGISFNLGCWGYTFPLGVFTMATLKLGALLPIGAITGFGQLLGGLLVLCWIVVAAKTVQGAWRGDLFAAPCLQG